MQIGGIASGASGIGPIMEQMAQSTQAAPNCYGLLMVGSGCGISTVCPNGFPPPQSVMAGICDARLGR